ncbi:MAG: hypothetical protein AAF985_04600 [Bacteroidota bacterium]
MTKNKIWVSYEPTYAPENEKYSEWFKFSDADVNDGPTGNLAYGRGESKLFSSVDVIKFFS